MSPISSKTPASDALFSAVGSFAADLVNWLAQNARRLVLGGVTLVALATGGAFAVVSVVPPDAGKQVQWIQQSVQSDLTLASPALSATVPISLYRSAITQSTDTVDGLLARLGVSDAEVAQFFRQNRQAQQALLTPGHWVRTQTNPRRQLTQMSILWPATQGDQFHRLRVERTPSGVQSSLGTEALTPVSRFASGEIKSSLFAATDEAGIPDAVSVQIAEIFSGEIDFHRDLRKGDRFTVVYQSLLADGEPMRTGKVLATDFVNNGQSLRAMWFNPNTASNTGGGYFTPEGKSLRKEFLASPLAFSRITSGFAMRLHPISRLWKAHLGVDYGAPTGTPVRTVGAGRVSFAGVQNGFGNVVFVEHNKSQTTVYAHLSKISVKKGDAVQQGQTIGAVGATGWATGPHLHFEFRVGGQHVDPITVIKKSQPLELVASQRPLFEAQAKLLSGQLAAAALVSVASAQ